MAGQESVSVLQERLASEQKLVALIDRIHSAKSLDAIFFEVQGEILSFLDTERMTLYVVDQEKKELFSKFLALDTVKEIRVPISESSVAGFVAFNPQTVNIADAYNSAEVQKISPKLRFDASWDKKTGFRTQQILAMPILHENKVVVGVIQLLNKKRGGRFTKEDESNVARIAKTLGVAFHTQQMLVQKRGNKFDYLLAQGLVTQDELNKAVATARQRQVDVETVLMEQYKVPKHELGASLSQFYRVPYFEFSEKLIPPPDLMRDLKIEFLKRNLWLPLRRDEHGNIVVLIDNPQDIQKVDSIHQVMRGHKIALAVGLLGAWFHSEGSPGKSMIRVAAAWALPPGKDGGMKPGTGRRVNRLTSGSSSMPSNAGRWRSANCTRRTSMAPQPTVPPRCRIRRSPFVVPVTAPTRRTR